MSELKIVAVIEIKELYKDELVNALHKLVDETRKESGVISYELHQDLKNPLKFIVLEIWKSKEAIEEHNRSIHFQDFVQFVDGKIESLTVDTIKKVY